MCVNGGRPIFGAKKISGKVQLDVPPGSGDDIIKQAIAAKLNIDKMKISLDGAARRSQQINFQLVGTPDEIDLLALTLSTMQGVTVKGDPEDAETEQTLRPGEIWEDISGVYMLRACPSGFVLKNSSIELQSCEPCGRGRYIIPGSSTCADCPDGAWCSDGAQFYPHVADSEWKVEISGLGVRRWRIHSCPAGYALVRTSKNPLGDTCTLCPGTQVFGYNIDGATWDPKRSEMGKADFCRECPLPIGSANCSGGTIVISNKGYWKMEENTTDASSRRDDSSTAKMFKMYQCRPGLCQANNTCDKGRFTFPAAINT